MQVQIGRRSNARTSPQTFGKRGAKRQAKTLQRWASAYLHTQHDVDALLSLPLLFACLICGYPLQDPVAIIGILGILLPFLAVAALVATGVIDPNPKSYGVP